MARRSFAITILVAFQLLWTWPGHEDLAAQGLSFAALLSAFPPTCASRAALSLETLLADPKHYHRQEVHVRGTVTRLQLHLDTTQLFIDFVFELKDGPFRIVVFGRHDRTQGDIQMATGETVDVQGMFWETRVAHGYTLHNQLEATSVSRVPCLTPDRARNPENHMRLAKASQNARQEFNRPGDP